jgi:hypothetical protein
MDLGKRGQLQTSPKLFDCRTHEDTGFLRRGLNERQLCGKSL